MESKYHIMKSITYAYNDTWQPEWTLDPAIRIVEYGEQFEWFKGTKIIIRTSYIHDDDIVYMTLKYPDIKFDTEIYS